MEGIPPAPRGMPQIEVKFDIDANGILHVSAKDLGTGREQNIRVVASSGLTEQDIERIIGEADAYKTSDHKRRELAELRNTAEALLYTSARVEPGVLPARGYDFRQPDLAAHIGLEPPGLLRHQVGIAQLVHEANGRVRDVQARQVRGVPELDVVIVDVEVDPAVGGAGEDDLIDSGPAKLRSRTSG